jgi:putative Mg2+ transporter-C (MgtC) family protein
VIFTQRGLVRGLTTAAGLWVVTAVGLAVGVGYYGLALLGTVLVVLIVAGLKRLERRLHAQAPSDVSEP